MILHQGLFTEVEQSNEQYLSETHSTRNRIKIRKQLCSVKTNLSPQQSKKYTHAIVKRYALPKNVTLFECSHALKHLARTLI